jgi:hypothetical protein
MTCLDGLTNMPMCSKLECTQIPLCGALIYTGKGWETGNGNQSQQAIAKGF